MGRLQLDSTAYTHIETTYEWLLLLTYVTKMAISTSFNLDKRFQCGQQMLFHFEIWTSTEGWNDAKNGATEHTEISRTKTEPHLDGMFHVSGAAFQQRFQNTAKLPKYSDHITPCRSGSPPAHRSKIIRCKNAFYVPVVRQWQFLHNELCNSLVVSRNLILQKISTQSHIFFSSYLSVSHNYKLISGTLRLTPTNFFSFVQAGETTF